MILFAILLDGLLTVFGSALGEVEVFGAFADDIGMVLHNLVRSLPIVITLLDRFRRISGLGLNYGKCVIVLLGGSDESNLVTRNILFHLVASFGMIPLSILVSSSALAPVGTSGTGQCVRPWMQSSNGPKRNAECSSILSPATFSFYRFLATSCS